MMSTHVSDYIGLYDGLYSLFPLDRRTLSVPYPNQANKKGELKVLIDWSNTRIGFDQLKRDIDRRYHKTPTPGLLNLEVLDLILVRGRQWSDKVISGSPSITDNAQFKKARTLGYKTHIFERNTVQYGQFTRQQEYGVDEILCYYINHFIRDLQPGTIALASGDGQPALHNPKSGFFISVKDALAHNWTIEIYSFGESLSKNWLYLKNLYPKNFCIIYLNEFVNYLWTDTVILFLGE